LVIDVKKRLLVAAVLTVFVVTLMVSTAHANTTPPQSLLRELEETIRDADDRLFRGYTVTNTKQLKDALVRKIDAVILLIDEGDGLAAYNKLHNDIARKLTICITNRVRARSWLSYTHPSPEDVYAFSAVCLELINRASLVLTQNS
jgi:hypothetical protein